MNVQELMKVITPSSGINLKENYPEIYISMLEQHIDHQDEILKKTETVSAGWKKLCEKQEEAVATFISQETS